MAAPPPAPKSPPETPRSAGVVPHAANSIAALTIACLNMTPYYPVSHQMQVLLTVSHRAHHAPRGSL